MTAVVIVEAAEFLEQGVELGDGGRCRRGRRSHFFRVCQDRSILPQVWG